MKTPGNILFTTEQIQQRVSELSQHIEKDYAGLDPVMLVILKGSFYFASDLTKSMDMPLALDFIATGHNPSGALEVIRRPLNSLKGRHVLLIEDIIDSGLTLGFMLNFLQEQEPADIAICTLLDNPARRLVQLPLRYTGFQVPDVFVVGYGLDFEENYRHLPCICEYSYPQPK